MHKIKSHLRSQMNNDTLNECMKTSINGPAMQDFDFDSTVKQWSSLKNKRIFQKQIIMHLHVHLYNWTAHDILLDFVLHSVLCLI